MATTDPSSDIARLRSDLEQIRRDLAAIGGTVKELSAVKGQEARARAEALRERALRRASAAEERLGQEINERPLASVLTAFGIGFVIGKLLD